MLGRDLYAHFHTRSQNVWHYSPEPGMSNCGRASGVSQTRRAGALRGPQYDLNPGPQ